MSRLVVVLVVGVGLLVGAVLVFGAGPVGADPTSHPTAHPTGPVASPSRTAPASPAPSSSSPAQGSTTSAPSATPSYTVPTDPGTDPGIDPGDGAGWFDVSGQVRKAINDFIRWVAQTGLKPVLDALGQTVLSTPDLTNNPQVKAVWTTSLITANGIFVLFVVAGGFLVTSRETLQNRYGLKEVAPRIAVAGVAANVSLLVCDKAISAVNALTAAIAGQGVDGKAAASALEQTLDQQVKGQSPSIVLSLLVLAVLVMAIVVIVTFIVRVALLVLLIGVAPLALLCHAHPHTEGLAYTWWRAFAACLGIQLGQALIILATLRVFLTPAGPEALGIPVTTGGLLGVLVCLTMLWLLIKLPGWTKHLVLGPLGRRYGRGLVGEVIHAVVMLKTLGALAAGDAHASRAGRPRSPGAAGHSPSGPMPAGGGYRARSRPHPAPSRPSRVGGSSRPRRPVPAPAGPAPFSHAPITQTPLPAPAGSPAPPAFSSTPQPAIARSAPPGTAAPVRFSHQTTPTPGTAPGTAPAAARPAPVRFSHSSTPAVPRRATGTAPAVAFSDAPRPQAAPKRPPAPATPMFSSPAPVAATPPPDPRRRRAGRGPAPRTRPDRSQEEGGR